MNHHLGDNEPSPKGKWTIHCQFFEQLIELALFLPLHLSFMCCSCWRLCFKVVQYSISNAQTTIKPHDLQPSDTDDKTRIGERLLSSPLRSCLYIYFNTLMNRYVWMLTTAHYILYTLLPTVSMKHEHSEGSQISLLLSPGLFTLSHRLRHTLAVWIWPCNQFLKK